MLGTASTVVYPVSDLDTARAWWSNALGMEPTDDHDFYVGFNRDGFEIGLDPHGFEDGLIGPVLYYSVEDVESERRALVRAGARQLQRVQDTPTVVLCLMQDADGNAIGLVQHRERQPAVSLR